MNLVKYLASVEAQSNPFDLSLVPTVSRAEIQSEHLQMKIKAQDAIASVPSPKKADALPLITSDLNYSKVIGSIPSLAVLGSILKSSQPVELTENDVEYVVSCVKHIFTQNIVFQV